MPIYLYEDYIKDYKLKYYIKELNQTIVEIKFLTDEEHSNLHNINQTKYFSDDELNETKLIKETHLELKAYFNGKLKVFSIPFKAAEGTIFMNMVWDALCAIPYGETSTYSEIANKIGKEKACRAVGLANNKNPLPILIPCHRVVGKNGNLTGYAGGLELKSKLLEVERGKGYE